MDTPNSNSMAIDRGPMAGWDISITHIPHGVDAMDDLYVLDLWAPDADHTAHAFETYRYAFGWNTLNTALAGADVEMQAALDWWTANHTTPAYAAHRILVAIDNTSWATTAEIAARLNLTPADLEADQPYGQALAATVQHQLTTWSKTRAIKGKAPVTPLVAITPAAYELIHPDDLTTAAKRQGRFTAALNTADTAQQTARSALSRAGEAFPHMTRPQAGIATPKDGLTVATANPRPLRPTR